jgi:hypothetical protein
LTSSSWTRASTYTLYRDDSEHDWRQVVFEKTAEHLRARGFRVRVQDSASFDVRVAGLFRRRIALEDSLAVLQNDQTGDYRALDCHDFPDPDELTWLLLDPRCKRVLKCQCLRPKFWNPGAGKVRPWTYFDTYWPRYEAILAALRRAPRTRNEMCFRGFLWDDRKPVLEILQQRGIVNPESASVPFDDFLTELARHKIVLSLPGIAEVCHRDMEAFGLGACVLRPRFTQEFHMAVEPSVHYISVETNIEKDAPEVAAARIEERYQWALRQPELLSAVAARAAQWYDQNVRTPESLDLTARLLGFGGDA